MISDKIVVTSPSFSKHPVLVEETKRHFSNVKLNTNGERLEGAALIEYLEDAVAAVVGLESITDEVLRSCPSLKLISKYGVGLNNLDLEACEKRGVKIGWTGGVNRRSVSEMALGFMLMLSRNLYQTSNKLKTGVWDKNGGFQLSGKTVGIIGVGNIGKDLVNLLRPFGCKILANDIINQDEYYAKNNLIAATKDEIYESADIITIHTPLTPQTRRLIDEAAFSKMKSNAIVINTARGGIVDESALKKALATKAIHAAAMDVYENEPPTDHELLSLPNLICTPHIGGNANEAVLAMGRSAIQHLKEYFVSEKHQLTNQL